MKRNCLFLQTIIILFFIASCKKNDMGTKTPAPKVTTGVYSLNQGNYGMNNTTITYYDFGTGTAAPDYFKAVNGFGLGDTGSDFIIYGGKIYIVMNNSGTVVVANALTLQFLDTIDFKNAGTNRGPENIVASGDKVFVSSTDGNVAVIDTTALSINKFIPVGSNPAQMTISGAKLYVSNTGGFIGGGQFDSTVSVIDLGSLTETSKITVGINPGSIAADSSGNIYVVCTGDYGAVLPSMVKVNTASNAVTKTADTAAGIVRYFNNNLYVTGGYLGVASARVLSTTDFSVLKSNFISDGTLVTTPYSLDIDHATGDVYIGDAKNYVTPGEIFCFDKNGNKKFSFSTTPTASPIGVQLIQH
jgi:YVTN family beta-propeller protein